MKSKRFGFRLKPERDDELISWLEDMGEGERSFFIREALRKAILQESGVPKFNSQRTETVSKPFPAIPQPVNEATADEPQQEDLENKLDNLTNLF